MMLYCTFEALKEMSFGGKREYTFITKNETYKDTIEVKLKQGLVNNCFKDGIGSIDKTATIICDYGKFEFFFTEYTVDIEMDTDLAGQTFTKKSLQECLNNGDVIICEYEEEATNIHKEQLYCLECIKENKNVREKFNLDKDIYSEIDLTTEEIKNKLDKKLFAIIPLTKKEDMLVYKDINIGLNQTYTFYKQFCPKLFYSIDKLLEKNIEILTDFANFKYCIVSIKKIKDKYKNEVLELNLLKELDIYEIMNLDNTGTTHLSIVSNYSNLDINKITESLKNVCANNKKVEPKLLFNYLKKTKINDISWIEDYIIESKYFFGYDTLLKILKTCKKIVDFDKVYNYILENGYMDDVVSAIKINKKANFDEIEDFIIKRFKKDDTYLSDFIVAFPEQKFDKIKKKLIESGLIKSNCYHIQCLFKSKIYNKIELIDELKEVGKENNEFLKSLIYYTQSLIRESKQEPILVDKIMKLMFKLDVNGEGCHDIYDHTYYNFSNYESDISKYWDEINYLNDVNRKFKNKNRK